MPTSKWEEDTKKRCVHDGRIAFLYAWCKGGGYQITTRSSAGRYIASPSLISKASKNGSRLRRDAFTRQRPVNAGRLCALQGFFLADVSGPYVGVRYEERWSECIRRLFRLRCRRGHCDKRCKLRERPPWSAIFSPRVRRPLAWVSPATTMESNCATRRRRVY